ncbi:MAG: mechanosensitive ion channel family protein [Clostridia bacterium]|nr:mechanosensitive ion channel family protein [Clostridia bacterium]
MEATSLPEATAEAVATMAPAAGDSSASFETIKTSVLSWLLTSGIKLLIAILILLVSFWIINLIAKGLKKRFDKNEKVDKTVSKTFIYIGKIVVKAVIVACLVAFVGIDTSALSALIASVGVTIGLAVNGTLGNIAGGMLIIITRPFRLDDFVDIGGSTGTVEDIKLCHTKLRTVDNKIIYVPNSTAASATVTNFSEKDLRRVDIDFSISYADDSAKAVEVILDTAGRDERILSEPAAPFAAVGSYDSSAVIIKSRNWVKSADYWDVYFSLLANVRKALEAGGITIPFNQIDVHIKKDD